MTFKDRHPADSRTELLRYSSPKPKRETWGEILVVGKAPPPPSRHLPVLKLRELKTRSILVRRRKTGWKERHMVGRRVRHRIRASIMKPMLIWMRTRGRRGNVQSHPQILSKVTLLPHPTDIPMSRPMDTPKVWQQTSSTSPKPLPRNPKMTLSQSHPRHL